ncbi:MAG: TPM domain-containing protein [Oculatellaceae cyanobacterium Prado106]|nr:TPM domain-containing protein [Oculatellaceae cyanobacterium Prado106]
MQFQVPSRQAWLTTWMLSLVGFIICCTTWLINPLPAQATGVYNMPTLKAGDITRLVDQAGVLSRLTQGELISQLDALAQSTGNEVRFVTIHRLDYEETIDSFAQDLFQKWFPTAEEQANQILVVLDNVTNTIAIQTGTEVKSLLSDEMADSITQETMMVPLRGGKYNQAFEDAGDRLTAILTGQPDPGPPIVTNDINTESTFATAEETDDRSATIVVIVLLALATIIPMATYYLYQILQS